MNKVQWCSMTFPRDEWSSRQKDSQRWTTLTFFFCSSQISTALSASLDTWTHSYCTSFLNGTTQVQGLCLAVPGGPYGFLSNHFTSPQDTTWAQVSLTCENVDIWQENRLWIGMVEHAWICSIWEETVFCGSAWAKRDLCPPKRQAVD
jgi:hypothetical protein